MVNPRPDRLLLLLSLALPGCSNGSDGPAQPPPPTATITADNLELAAAAALQASLGIAPVAALAGGALEPTSSPLNWRAFALQRFAELLLPQRVLLATLTVTRNGPGGGTATITWEDNDNDEQVTTGDTFAMVFDGYSEWGLRLDGNLLVDRVEVSGSLATDLAWTIRARFTFDEFAWTNINGSAPPRTVAGEIAARIEQRSTVTRLAVQPLVNLTSGDGTLSTGSTVLYDEFTSGEYQYLWRIESRGTVGHPQLDGTVAFRTDRAFSARVWEQVPSSGVLLVTGGNRAMLRLTARESGDVLMETDLDGDGTFETSTPIDWAELGF